MHGALSMTRASIALYVCQQRASMPLATILIMDHVAYDSSARPALTWLQPIQRSLEIDIGRAALENVRPHRLPGRFPWK